ncbi:Ankyrin_repeat-containing protein [Hexamita inflata]|uniref:Ankyrin repeat-containing protein n=1 Tax=Hexamita inflata TaxID=28002 RepID=A0AA86TMZ4_9EUKA|nr:Ankyrin repeat-containing protein [Hexamita inflata]CAI9978114.1 Ankyrin repeat-containing protein [Hexamita inflata]
MQNWFLAADGDDVSFIRMHAPTLLHSVDNQGNTALIRAAFAGSFNIIPLLQKELGQQNAIGRTALMQAIFSKCSTLTVPLLMDEINSKDYQGQTALMLAAGQNNKPIVQMLLKEAKMKDSKGRTALMIAASLGHYEIVQILKHEEQKLQDSNGLTALMYAAYKGNIEIVQSLAELEAQITNVKGDNALAIGIQKNNQRIAEILSKYEGDQLICGMNVLEYCQEFNSDFIHIFQDIGVHNSGINFDSVKKSLGINVLDEYLSKQPEIVQKAEIQNINSQIRSNSPLKQSIEQNAQPQKQIQSNTNQTTNNLMNNNQSIMNNLQSNQLQNEFNAQILNQFSTLQNETIKQLQQFQLKSSQLGVEMVKIQNQINQNESVKETVEELKNKLDNQNEHNQIRDLKKQINELNNRIQAIEDKPETVKEVVKVVKEVESAKVNQINQVTKSESDLQPNTQNNDVIHSQISQLQSNMVQILQIVQNQPELQIKANLLQMEQNIEILQMEVAKIKAQNVDSRVSTLESAVHKIMQAWKIE